MKSSFCLVGSFALVVCLTSGGNADAAAVSPNCSALSSSPIFQVVNASTKASLLTSSKDQAGSAPTTLFSASQTSATGLVGAHRMYNASSKDYFWTISSNEVASAAKNYGYVDQGISFFVSSAAATCTQPVYRFQSGAMHRFAVSQADQNALKDSGWKSEGIVFYGGLPPMPTGNLPGWTLVYSNDFNSPLDFKNAWGYYDGTVSGANPDTSYWSKDHLTVADGILNLNGYVDSKVPAKYQGRVTTGGLGLWTLRDEKGQIGQKYGKWEMLVRIDQCPDVKYAWLLWPASGNWPSGGEVDFAEDGGGNRASTGATIHYANASGKDAILPQDSFPNPASPGFFSSWHVIGVEWTAAQIRYTLDGQYWGTPKTTHLPPGPMVFVMQTEGLLGPTKVTLGSGQCSAQIGWVVQYKP